MDNAPRDPDSRGESPMIGGGPMTPGKLRSIADWLDTYDGLANVLLDLIRLRRIDVSEKVRGTVYAATAVASGKEVQADLRRWADEMEMAGRTSSCRHCGDTIRYENGRWGHDTALDQRWCGAAEPISMAEAKP